MFAVFCEACKNVFYVLTVYDHAHPCHYCKETNCTHLADQGEINACKEPPSDNQRP